VGLNPKIGRWLSNSGKIVKGVKTVPRLESATTNAPLNVGYGAIYMPGAFFEHYSVLT